MQNTKTFSKRMVRIDPVTDRHRHNSVLIKQLKKWLKHVGLKNGIVTGNKNLSYKDEETKIGSHS